MSVSASRRGTLTANTPVFQLPAAVVSRTHRWPAAEARTIVKLISSGTPGYDVQGINPKAVTS